MPTGALCVHKGDTKKCLIVVGGIHGNEPSGLRAIETLYKKIREGECIKGSVYTLIGNPEACEKNVRFIDENLNRAFNGATNQTSYETRRANELIAWLEHIARTYDEWYVLDLHSVSLGDTRIAICSAEDMRARTWIEQVSPIPFRIVDTSCVLPDSFIGACTRLGGVATSIECGNHVAEHAIDIALDHIERALESLVFVEKRSVILDPALYAGNARTYSLFARIVPHTNFAFTIPVATETLITAGTMFARDSDGEHRAPRDCYAIMPAKHPDPKDTDAGFLADRIS